MHMRRLLLLVLLAASAVAETPLGIARIGPASDDQENPALASNGDGFLAVWADTRSRERELWATRLDRDGNVLDPAGIRVSGIPRAGQPLAIWTGTSYLVVWGTRDNPQLWGARIDADGKLVDGPRVLAPNGQLSSLAANGSHVVVGYVREGYDVHALFLTPDAEVLSDLILAQDFRQHSGPSIVRSGSHFTAVWNTLGPPYSVDGVRFTIAGAMEPARRLTSDGATLDPKLATDGSDFVLVTRGNEYGTPFAARPVSGDLATVGAPSALPETIQYSVAIVWAGSHYIVVGEAGPLQAVHVDRQGRPLDTSAVRLDTALLRVAGTPGLATNGQIALVGWAGSFEFFKPSGTDVHATRIDPNTLAPLGRILVSTGVLRESNPVLASGTANVLAVWSDDAGILARRMRKDGSPLDPAPLRLVETSTERPAPHAVVFNGTNYVVAWSEGTDLVTRRVRHDGELRADGGGRISGGSMVPIERIAAASTGAVTLLVWGGAGLRAARVAANGSVADAQPLTIVDKRIGSLDVAASDRGQFLVVWGELELLPPTFETYLPLRVRAARITATLTNLDGRGFDVADTSALEGDPAVAWNGREWFVVWTEARKSVRGRRVAVNGTLDGGDVFVAGEASHPDVVWDGFRHVISWRSPTALRVGAHVVGPSEVRTSAAPSLAAVGPGTVMAAYTRVAREPGMGGVARAFVEVLGPPNKRRAVAIR